MKILGRQTVPQEIVDQNANYVAGLGLPRIDEYPARGERLAVVGSAPGISEHASALKEFDDIWAVNAASKVLNDLDIDHAFMNAGVTDKNSHYVGYSDRALLANNASPRMVRAATEANMRIWVFQPAGPTAVTCSIEPAFKIGYKHITFFGCSCNHAEGFEAKAGPRADWLTVECNGETFRTDGELYMQAEILSECIRDFPNYFAEESGGFLRAASKHGNKPVIRELADRIKRIYDDIGYELPSFDCKEVA